MKCMVTHVVMGSSHGNMLHYDLTMFEEFENLLYPKVASYMTQFQSQISQAFPLASFKLIK